jgi:hypothetical protein
MAELARRTTASHYRTPGQCHVAWGWNEFQIMAVGVLPLPGTP